jgi:[protein-PII] uridylyltransferase
MTGANGANHPMDLAPVPDARRPPRPSNPASRTGARSCRRDETLRQAFFAQSDPPRLLHGLARLADEIVVNVWAEADMPAAATLVAVGGYGRGQLFPIRTSTC